MKPHLWLALVLLVAAPLQAQLVSVGPESRVDSGKDRDPAYLDVSMEPDGSFLVVWSYRQEYASFSCDPGAIRARRFDREGRPLSKPFTLVRLAGACVADLKVGPLVDGRRLLAWTEAGGKYGGRQRIVATLGSDGHATRRKEIDGYSTSTHLLGSGHFLIVTQAPAGKKKTELRGRRFSASGRPDGSAFVIASGPGSFLQMDAVEISGGNLVVSWVHKAPNSERQDTYAQILRADGSRKGNPFLVTSNIDGEGIIYLASDISGGFVFAWSASPVENDQIVPVIRVRSFDADGTPRSPLVELTRSTWDYPRWVSDVAMNASGQFVPVWDVLTEWRLDDVGAALVDADGHLLGDEEPLAAAPVGLQGNPAVATDGHGLWVVAWMGEGPQGKGVYARLFTSAE